LKSYTGSLGVAYLLPEGHQLHREHPQNSGTPAMPIMSGEGGGYPAKLIDQHQFFPCPSLPSKLLGYQIT